MFGQKVVWTKIVWPKGFLDNGVVWTKLGRRGGVQQGSMSCLATINTRAWPGADRVALERGGKRGGEHCGKPLAILHMAPANISSCTARVISSERCALRTPSPCRGVLTQMSSLVTKQQGPCPIPRISAVSDTSLRTALHYTGEAGCEVLAGLGDGLGPAHDMLQEYLKANK